MAAGKAGNWQANAWLLERKYPDEFARREKREVKVSGEIKTREKPDLSKLSRPELDELERITGKACNGQAGRN